MKKLKKYFISGLLVFLPLTLTVYLFIWVLSFTDGLLGKYIEPYFLREFGFYVEGLSIIIGVCLIVLIGFLATHYLGRKIYLRVEKILVKLPFFRQVYPSLKEIAFFVFSRDRMALKQVVFVEYPRKGLYTLGFLTNETDAKIARSISGGEMCNVLIPSVPNPLTGYVVIVPKDEIILSDMTIEEAIKFMVSGGVINPSGVGTIDAEDHG